MVIILRKIQAPARRRPGPLPLLHGRLAQRCSGAPRSLCLLPRLRDRLLRLHLRPALLTCGGPLRGQVPTPPLSTHATHGPTRGKPTTTAPAPTPSSSCPPHQVLDGMPKQRPFRPPVFLLRC